MAAECFGQASICFPFTGFSHENNHHSSVFSSYPFWDWFSTSFSVSLGDGIYFLNAPQVLLKILKRIAYYGLNGEGVELVAASFA